MVKIIKCLLGFIFNFFSMSAVAGLYIVEMNRPLEQAELNELLNTQGVAKVDSFTPFDDPYFNKLYVINFNDKKYDLDFLKSYKLVRKIEKSFDAQVFEIKPNPQSKMITNDMLLPLQWGLFNQEQTIVKQKLSGQQPIELIGIKGKDIGFNNSIDKIEKNLKKTPTVAVIDTGVDIDHPELKDQILKNEKECDENGMPYLDRSIDRDNNGFKSDCHGFNFAATDPQYFQFPLDDKNHGTHVAGIIAAKRDNNIGIAGVSDKIKILPVKVTGFVDETSDRDNLILKAPSQRIAQGILYAVTRGVDVINLSLGWPKSMDTEYMRRAILIAKSRNISIVAAAGNNNTNANIYPCAYQGVICVGSINADGNISDFSNFGGEVDILAPGDQILSTIPTTFAPIKMNIQGYDILSGTSQAAPFVSAAAALLKSTYPELTPDEIKGHLYNGATKKDDQFKSMTGILNLQKTFERVNKSRVIPLFKSRIAYSKVPSSNNDGNFTEKFTLTQRSELLFNKLNGKFVFPLYLQNIGTSLENKKIKVAIKFHTSGIALEANTFIVGEKDLSRPLGIKGRVLNKYMDNMVRYSVTITELKHNEVTGSFEDLSSEQYMHEISMAKKSVIIGRDKKIASGIKLIMGEELKDNKEVANNLHRYLRTVSENILKSDYPTYYIKHGPVKTSDNTNSGIKVFFFNNKNSRYEQDASFFYAKDAIKLLEVTKGDYNYDGQSDYLIKTIISPQNDSNEEGYILYSYRDIDLKPLVGKFSDIRYYPKYVNITPKTVRLSKTKLPNNMLLATPNFIAQGKVPDEDQIVDPWIRKDLSSLRRIYSLKVVENNFVEYKARTFMNIKFIQKVKEQMISYDDLTISNNDTNVEIINLENQTKEQYYNDKVTALASYGLGFLRTNIKITITENEIVTTPAQYIRQNLLGQAHHNVIDLSGNAVNYLEQNAYVGFLTSELISVTTDNGSSEKSYYYKDKEENDKVLSFLSIFEKDNAQYLFMETIDHLLLVKNFNNQQKIAKRKTKKFSFLPGSKMSELYYPIVVKDIKGELKPAIYVDATQLSDNHIYVNTFIEDKLVAPIDLSLAVPSYCSAKNPAPSKAGAFNYVLVCKYGGEYKILFEQLVSM